MPLPARYLAGELAEPLPTTDGGVQRAVAASGIAVHDGKAGGASERRLEH